MVVLVDHLDEDLLKTFQSEVFKLFKTAISFDEEFGCFADLFPGADRRRGCISAAKSQANPCPST